MLVMGFGKRTYKDRGPGETRTCPRCQRTGRFLLTEARSWFSLFFVPLIPYARHYLEVCPNCEFSHEMNEKEFEGIAASAEADRSYLIGQG